MGTIRPTRTFSTRLILAGLLVLVLRIPESNAGGGFWGRQQRSTIPGRAWGTAMTHHPIMSNEKYDGSFSSTTTTDPPLLHFSNKDRFHWLLTTTLLRGGSTGTCCCFFFILFLVWRVRRMYVRVPQNGARRWVLAATRLAHVLFVLFLSLSRSLSLSRACRMMFAGCCTASAGFWCDVLQKPNLRPAHPPKSRPRKRKRPAPP